MDQDDRQRGIEEEIFGREDEDLSDLDDDLGEFEEVIDNAGVNPALILSSESAALSQQTRLNMNEDRKRRKEERRQRREAKEAKRRAREERDLGNVAEAAPINPVLAEFESVVNSFKNKRKGGDYDEMDADEIIIRVCNEMKVAVELDVEANSRREPALAKLKLMPRVTGLLEKAYMHEQLLENEMLTAIRMFLEPLPDGSLPSITIRKPLLNYLAKLPVTTDYIRESRIGRVVMFYYKCEKELPELRKLAADLIGLWSRPILQQIKRSRPDEVADYEDRAGGDMASDEHGARTRVGDPGYDYKTARIPANNRATYVHAPPSNIGDSFREKGENKYKSIIQKMQKKKSR